METCTKTKKLKESSLDTFCNVTERYILVGWPEIQEYMEHSRWDECILCIETEGAPMP